MASTSLTLSPPEPPVIWTPPTAVTVARHAFRTETITLEMPHGATLDEIIVAAGIPPGATVRVWVDDWQVAPQYWGTTRPRPGRRVLIRAVAGGGGGGDSNKTLRIVLLAVIIIAAIVVSVVSYGILTGPAIGMSVMAAGALSAGLAAAVSIGGQYALNALLPPPKPRLRDQTAIGISSTYALTGTQNQLAPYQAVPRVYGRHRLYPPLAAHPVTAGHLTTQTLSQLFTLGYGPLQIENIRIGDTPVEFYEGVTLEVRHGWPGDAPLSTFPYNAIEEPLAIDLTPPAGSLINTATRVIAGPVDVIGIEILFPRGLFRVDENNEMHAMSGTLFVNASPASTGEAVPLLAQAINEQRPETLRFSYAFDVQAYGDTAWTITVAWTIPEGWAGPPWPNPVVIYDAQWVALRTTVYEDPIPLPGMAKIGVTLTASGQLSGVVNQLNCIATSILQVWTEPTGWSLLPTRNPAWVYADILTGTANARPVDAPQIDWPALLVWGADCDARGYTFDAVFDAQTTVFEALSLVAAAGRASFTMRDGMYSIVRDVPQTVPVQQFTPRNSTGFSATKVFTDIPHALKVRFINPQANWQQDEQLVYNDGYDSTTATRFEGLELFGCTDALLAWRHGRYWIAAARLRPETYTLGVDIEHLIAQRGDLVHVQHDVPLWGYGSGRITSVTRDGGGLVILFSLDELFADVPWATTAAARVRFESGESGVYNVSMYPRPELRVTDFSLHTPQALPLNLGDLVSIGEMGQETVPCLIARIEAGPDLSARLTLVDLAPGIHSADTGPIPPFNSFVTRVPVLNRLPPLPPIIDGWGSDELHMLEVSPGNWVISIRVAAHAQVVPDRLVPTLLELQFRPVGSAAQWTQLPPQSVTAGGHATFYAVPVTAGVTYDVRVRAVAGPESVASTWATFTHQVVGEITPPPPPINLALDLDQAHLRWQYPTPPRDFPGGFQVRYAYGVTDRWENTWPLHDGLVSDTRFALPPLGAGTYTFLVKAVDRGGHLSRDAAVLVTDYAGYAPVNILNVIDLDAAGFPGDQDSLVYEDTPPPPRLCNALLTDGPFWTVDGARFWSADAALFWGDVYAAGSYQIGIDVPVEDAGTTLTLDWAGTGPWVVEYRTAGDSAFWARHTPYFWETAATVFWGEGVGAWRPWPGALVVQAQHYDIRWSTPGPQEACLTRVHLVFDVEDVIEFLDDIVLAAVPTRLPITEVYRAILNVQLTVVQTVGAPVRIVDVLDKAVAGPLVRARLSDGTATTAQIDAIIRGY